MPLTHLTLTVSHLASSTSFFLSCLQPLGYRFIGRHDDYIGFGAEPGVPADFWITEQKPGVPPGAAHVAFPAPSREAVSHFFIAALKAGGKIHGEPKMRDSEQEYYSAAVIDFDGNSIEAVHRPSLSDSSEKAPTVVSRATSVKQPKAITAPSEAGSKVSVGSKAARTVISRAAPSVAASRASPSMVSIREEPQAQPPAEPPRRQSEPVTHSYVQRPQPQRANTGNQTAKAIVGTLLGATAGAAIAYAMVRSESEPEPAPQFREPVYHEQQRVEAPPSHVQDHSPYRAIEPAPPSSVHSGQNPYSQIARTVLSKNPRASTIYEDVENLTRIMAGSPSVSSEDQGRRASSASVYSSSDHPLRAIEAPPDMQRSPSYPSTFISSYREKSRAFDEESMRSASTLKAPKSIHSSHSYQSRMSDKASHYSHQSHHTAKSSHHSHSVITISELPPRSQAGSMHSAQSARHIALPASSVGSKVSKASRDMYVSPHEMPLPESRATSTVFLDTVDVDTHVSPYDSISQAGSRRSRKSHSGESHQSHHSHHSKRSSKFDEPVKPSDSVSQVSVSSQRTIKAPSKVGSTAGSKAPSKAPSKTPSKTPSKAPSVSASKAGSKVSSSSRR